MARDTTPVTVTLDRQRPYRVRDEDRTAVWVGPGEASVPRWVAEAWGMVTPKQTTGQTDDDVETGNALDGLGLKDEQIAALTEAGYGDRHALANATDDELIALPTIGKATVRNLREALSQ